LEISTMQTKLSGTSWQLYAA